jgi:hypothetical protein
MKTCPWLVKVGFVRTGSVRKMRFRREEEAREYADKWLIKGGRHYRIEITLAPRRVAERRMGGGAGAATAPQTAA